MAHPVHSNNVCLDRSISKSGSESKFKIELLIKIVLYTIHEY